MGARRQKLVIVALGIGVFIGSCAVVQLLVSRTPIAPALAADDVVGVDIELPEIPGHHDDEQKKHCHGCSLGHHEIPPYTDEVYREAVESYARMPYWQQSEGLDTLLFYGDETLEKLEKLGTGSLSAEHLAFLRRELTRTHAVVHIRVVDEHGEVRVDYGPERVPLKVKEHLWAKENGNLFAMSFNGTVVRTGLYHLWSRY